LECERFDPHVLCLAELLCLDLDTLDYGYDFVVEPVRDNDSVPDDKNFLLHDHDDMPFRACVDAQPLLDSALGCELVPDAPTLHNLEPKIAAHTDDPVPDDKHFPLHDHDDKLLCFRADALRRAFGPDVPLLHCLVPNLADLHDNDTVTDDKPFLQNDPNDEMHMPDLVPGLAPEHDTDVPPQLMRDLQLYYKANRMDFGGCCPLGCGATDFAGHFRSCRFVLREVTVRMRGIIADDPCAAQFPRALDPDKMRGRIVEYYSLVDSADVAEEEASIAAMLTRCQAYAASLQAPCVEVPPFDEVPSPEEMITSALQLRAHRFVKTVT